MRTRLRIAILAHSTNPRGGVVHALELGDALCRLGYAATVHAPDSAGTSFFRATMCHTVRVAASRVGRGVTAMVETRVADYLHHFERAENRDFDIWHAQDGISANALATLKERGLISGFARTVHHVDTFADHRLAALPGAKGDDQDQADPEDRDHRAEFLVEGHLLHGRSGVEMGCLTVRTWVRTRPSACVNGSRKRARDPGGTLA